MSKAGQVEARTLVCGRGQLWGWKWQPAINTTALNATPLIPTGSLILCWCITKAGMPVSHNASRASEQQHLFGLHRPNHRGGGALPCTLIAAAHSTQHSRYMVKANKSLPAVTGGCHPPCVPASLVRLLQCV